MKKLGTALNPVDIMPKLQQQIQDIGWPSARRPHENIITCNHKDIHLKIELLPEMLLNSWQSLLTKRTCNESSFKRSMRDHGSQGKEKGQKKKLCLSSLSPEQGPAEDIERFSAAVWPKHQIYSESLSSEL